MNPAKKILMVDDDDDLRKLLGIYLNMAGYEIFHAIHGEDGKEQLKTLTPDLIILDMMMPVLDGMGFLRWLRIDAQQKNIPVLSLTGRSHSKTKSEVLALGASEVFFKPCDPEQVVAYANKLFE
ncbi:MAG: response regulator [Candidatus Parabeggiatoa sp.]|nr:response regulator [Candidatus Parabeggiatoa sp.]